MKNNSFKSLSALFLASIIWGLAFTAQQVGITRVDSFSFNSSRTLLGSIFLALVITIRNLIHKTFHSNTYVSNPWYKDKALLKGSIVCGIVLTFATLFQQFGLLYTIVGKSSFITALYILFVPIIGLFTGKKISFNVIIGVILSLIGMYLLCINDISKINLGDILTLICAVFFSIHILCVDYYSPKTKPLSLCCGQLFIVSLISGILAIIFDTNPFGNLNLAVRPLLYSGILSCGFAYTLQIIGQRNSKPTLSAIIMSSESVFGLLGGLIILKQQITLKESIGCLFMFVAILIAQLSPNKKTINS